MSVAFTFGSFGDIITVLQLAWQLRAALDEATGACAEIKSLVADIDVFVDALQNIQTFVERRRKTLRPDVINGLGAALTRCRDTLRTILLKIKRAEARFSGSKWQKHLGSAAWSILGSKKDVDALRQHLSEQVNVIQLYLGLSQAQDQDAIGHQLERHGATLERICGVLHDIQIRFDVGVPSFLFYDAGSYYQPLVRTSFQRFCEVWKELADFDLQRVIKIELWLYSRRQRLRRIEKNKSKKPLDFRYRGVQMSCLFFKDAAFGEWQVLIGTGSQVSDFDRVLKFLLQRRHGFREACNCGRHVRRCRESEREFVQRRDDAALTYVEAANLYLTNALSFRPALDRNRLYKAIHDVLSEGPDPDYVRSVWIPRTKSAQSLSDMAALLQPTTGLGASVRFRISVDRLAKMLQTIGRPEPRPCLLM